MSRCDINYMYLIDDHIKKTSNDAKLELIAIHVYGKLITSTYNYIIISHKLIGALIKWVWFWKFGLNLVLLSRIFRSYHQNALRWMPLYLTDNKSALVPVIAYCHQATRRYMSRYWCRFMSSYGVTGPQWVNFNGVNQTTVEVYTWMNYHVLVYFY